MKLSGTHLKSAAVVVFGLLAIYLWIAVIENYGFLPFLGVLVVSWTLNLPVSAIPTEPEKDKRTKKDDIVDAVKLTVSLFAYSTLGAATLVVAYQAAKTGFFLYERFSEFAAGAMEGYRKF